PSTGCEHILSNHHNGPRSWENSGLRPRPSSPGLLESFPQTCSARAESDGTKLTLCAGPRRSPQEFGKCLRLSISVHAGERRVTLGKQGSISQELVAVDDLDVSHLLHRGPEDQQIIVEGRTLELAADVHDNQKMSGVLDLPVGEASLAE